MFVGFRVVSCEVDVIQREPGLLYAVQYHRIVGGERSASSKSLSEASITSGVR